MTLPVRTLSALSGVALVFLGACSGSGTSASSTAASTSTSTTTSTPAAGDASSASPSASDSPSATESASATQSPSASATPTSEVEPDPANATKTFTDATLAKAITGAKVGGVALDVAGPSDVASFVKGMQNAAAGFAKVPVKPDACKKATITSGAAIKGDQARALAGSDAFPAVVVLRSQPDVKTAIAAVEALEQANRQCASLTIPGTKAKVTTVVRPVTSPTITQATTAAAQGVGADGKATRQSMAVGRYGNVLVQVMSPDGSVPAAKLAQYLGDAGKALAAQMK